jgi:hypothetical protein
VKLNLGNAFHYSFHKIVQFPSKTRNIYNFYIYLHGCERFRVTFNVVYIRLQATGVSSPSDQGKCLF